jgi:hypothetical protein
METTPALDTQATTLVSTATTNALGQEAIQHLRAAQGNLEGFAEQVARGEYGPNGAGDAGRIWRTLSALEDSSQLVDAWGEIMAMSTGLWSVGKLSEAIELVDASARSFTVPDVWRKRVDDSLKAAKDYQAAREAESAFQDGRDDDALQYAGKISDQSEAEHYRRILKLRLERRKKQRRAIFTIAGVAMLSLLIASGIAISTMGRISIAPPAPDFTGFGDALEQVSNDLREQRDARDGTTPTNGPNEDSNTAPVPTGTADSGGDTGATDSTNSMPDLDSLLGGDREGTPAPQEAAQTQTPTPAPAPTETPTPADSASAILGPNADQGTQQEATQSQQTTEPADEPTVQPAPEPAGEPTPAPAPVPTESAGTNGAEQGTDQSTDQAGDLRANCILGYGGLSEAQKLVDGARAGLSQADLRTVDTRIMDFTKTLENACAKANIGTTELLRGVAEIEPQQLRAIAESILLGQQ